MSEPDRLRQEFERRQESPVSDQDAQSERLRVAITKVKQSISRLIDAYTAGLVEAGEFEPRIRRLKERLAKLDGELHQLAQQAKQDEELRLVFSGFEDFADQINESLTSANGEQRREILRALVKRVEVDKHNVRIVYKVPARPFVKSPNRGLLQHCCRRQPHCNPFFCPRLPRVDRLAPGSQCVGESGQEAIWFCSNLLS